MTISKAARASGVSAANIRYYEQEGLIPKAAVAANGYRSFDAADVARLEFVRRLRSLGMSLEEVRYFLQLDLQSQTDCSQARVALDAHLQHVDERIAQLHALRGQLSSLAARCDGSRMPCQIIEALVLGSQDDANATAVHAICKPQQTAGNLR